MNIWYMFSDKYLHHYCFLGFNRRFCSFQGARKLTSNHSELPSEIFTKAHRNISGHSPRRDTKGHVLCVSFVNYRDKEANKYYSTHIYSIGIGRICAITVFLRNNSCSMFEREFVLFYHSATIKYGYILDLIIHGPLGDLKKNIGK